MTSIRSARRLPISARRAKRLSAAVVLAVCGVARAYDISSPAILQDFENTDNTITNRMADVFAAGYGSMWLPPAGRADSGNTSVGYDVYDRFDLGSPGNPTLYGTQTGLQTTINAIHTMGGNAYLDLVWNHSGFKNNTTTGFAAAGGYPGFAVTLQNTNPSQPGYNTLGYNDSDGDYHPASANTTTTMRISGLDDIAQEKQYNFIRQPTVAGPNNIPAGTTALNGRLANVPNAANAQYYPDTSLAGPTLSDPSISSSPIQMHPFNLANPMNGTPIVEDDQQYLQRYAQWMVQVIGVDGFRVDAAKNMPTSVMNYLDLAVYHESNRTLLNGQQENIFSFQEVFDGSASTLQPYVLKNINPATPNTVGGNRDVLDFPLYFALQSNLTTNGAFGSGQNNWNNVVNASIDASDDGKHNGSQGVMFVQSADSPAPALGNVAYAYMLMQPGNAIVYTNGHEFGTEAQRSFPQDGRADALGGTYGTTITTLVDLRNRYGRGNYKSDLLEQNLFAMERQGSVLMLYSNTTDAGYDTRTVQVHFAPGTPLVELTGNAHGSFADPNGDIPQTIVVNADPGFPTGASVNVRFLRNAVTPTGGATYSTGDGYLIYGPATPTGTMSLTNVSKVQNGTIPNQNDSNIAFENGTDRVSSIDVIKSATFQVSLATSQSNLIGYGHDHAADGSKAMIRVDGGIDVSGSGLVTDPTSEAYGFGSFVTVNSPGYSANNGAGGNGQYTQTINTAQLGQGYHYITAIAYRFNSDPTQPQVYNDWKQTIYVDLAPPNSGVVSFNPSSTGQTTTRTLVVQSIDKLSNNTHVFLDLPFGESDAQVLALVGSGNQPTQTDVNLWQKNFSSTTSGNHTVTIVSFKPDGTSGVQRFSSQQVPALATTTSSGAGVGDLNFDGSINATDVNLFTPIVQSNNTQFNAAADINGDGLVDLADTFLLGPILSAHNADFTAFNNFIHSSYVTTGTYTVNGSNNIFEDTAGTTNTTAGSSLTASYVRGNTLSLVGGATVTIRSNATEANGISVLSHLNFGGSLNNWSGKLDLTNNNLIVSAPAASLANITNQLKTGFAAGSGYWNGANGIESSAAATDTRHLTTLGVLLNDNLDPLHPAPLYISMNGQPTGLDDVLVKYTYYGDATLDGSVNGADYQQIDKGFGLGLGGWSNGDFNYDGVINGADYALIDNTVNQISSANLSPLALDAMPTSQITQAAPTTTAVPEPGAGLVVLAAAGLLGRRRRAGRIA